MKLRCDDCHHEIKAVPVKEDRRHFCDERCLTHWKRKKARLDAEQNRQAPAGT